ncbi:hypothetical protein [Amycolatopsis magusensis]|uniref:Uncharacterized protein n=1 Tax=Amycolatopsis magusensis TaxID=882444 RepID=A0ABS4Q2Z7_9PSEU|nr:hypothetical protein [Amycolatopsis magusensis]MBP2185453.1 hypothetical protein [Amycolatopsis magusensis]MDI5976112.1 hypothetical protein [Amycolatopsis magusensis]
MDIPEGLGDVAAHQRATLDYGIASLRFALDWFRDYADRHGVEANQSTQAQSDAIIGRGTCANRPAP